MYGCLSVFVFFSVCDVSSISLLNMILVKEGFFERVYVLSVTDSEKRGEGRKDESPFSFCFIFKKQHEVHHHSCIHFDTFQKCFMYREHNASYHLPPLHYPSQLMS